MNLAKQSNAKRHGFTRAEPVTQFCEIHSRPLRSPGAPARVVDPGLRCGYSNYTMVRRGTGSRRRSAHSLEFKVVPIGNSRGVRLPKAVLDKYAIRDAVVVEEREEGLLLRSKKDRRLSWEETFKAMAYEREDWSDLDGTLNDGLDKEPW